MTFPPITRAERRELAWLLVECAAFTAFYWWWLP